MSILTTRTAAPITLDQLAALSDEIAALARAGVPLDRGLAELARDLPGRLGRLADELGRRLSAGEPLDRAVAERLGTSLPPAYRAVIAAGQRAGRLPAALEEISATARRIAELRRTIGLALLYPLVVLSVAWVLFLFVLVKILPVTTRMMVEFGFPVEPLERVIGQLGATAHLWGPLVPLAAAVWLTIVWVRSGRVTEGVELPGLFSFGAIGLVRRMQRAARLASLADLLGLLVAHEVPLPEAIELASAAVGQPTLAKAGGQLAARLERGETIDRPPPGFPPLLAWLIAGRSPQPALAGALHRTARVYRDEFNRRGQWLSLYVPLIATVLVGGTMTALYALLTLGPWLMIMHRLAQVSEAS